MRQSESDTRALPAPRARPTAPPRLHNCNCSRHGRRLAAKFTEEPYSQLQCYCNLVPTKWCLCEYEFPPHVRVAQITLREELYNYSDFDTEADLQATEIGKLLHCVVRDAANKTDSTMPPNITFSDYESAVFEGSFPRPFSLWIPVRLLVGYFRKRTGYRHQDLLAKYWTEKNRTKPIPGPEEGGRDIPAPEPAGPINLGSDPGDFLFEIRNMPKSSKRTTWQVIYLLRVSGLASNDSQAYDMVWEKGWPHAKTRNNLRSRFDRGSEYLSGKVKNIESASQANDLEALCHLGGLAAAVSWVITDPEDQELFLMHFGVEY